MPRVPQVVFLESHYQIESLFTRGLRSGAQKNGWRTKMIFLQDPAGRPRDVARLQDEILAAKPDLICFLMDAPLRWPTLWKQPQLEVLPKLSLWFDDFYRSPHTLGNPEIWRTWQSEHGVRVLIWDGFWRRKWEAFTQCPAFPVHLAGHPDESPHRRPLFPELCDQAVMVGTIPSRYSLSEEIAGMPVSVRMTIDPFVDQLYRSPWPVRPYELWESLLQQTPKKIFSSVLQWLETPTNHAVLNHLLWRWGKRVARIRGLAAMLRAGPVAVLSGHRTEEFAREEELRRELSPYGKLTFIDTTNIPAQDWPGLFRSGRFQIQVLDPQSVEGGIPFRLFECGAAGAPLLSDSRPEFEEMIQDRREIFLVKNEAGLTHMGLLLWKMEVTDLEPFGIAAQRRFQQDHTWQKRWNQLVNPDSASAEVGMAKKIEETVRRKWTTESTSHHPKRRPVLNPKVPPQIPNPLRVSSTLELGS